MTIPTEATSAAVIAAIDRLVANGEKTIVMPAGYLRQVITEAAELVALRRQVAEAREAWAEAPGIYHDEADNRFDYVCVGCFAWHPETADKLIHHGNCPVPRLHAILSGTEARGE